MVSSQGTAENEQRTHLRRQLTRAHTRYSSAAASAPPVCRICHYRQGKGAVTAAVESEPTPGVLTAIREQQKTIKKTVNTRVHTRQYTNTHTHLARPRRRCVSPHVRKPYSYLTDRERKRRAWLRIRIITEPNRFSSNRAHFAQSEQSSAPPTHGPEKGRKQATERSGNGSCRDRARVRRTNCM